MPPESFIQVATGVAGALVVALWVAWEFAHGRWHSNPEYQQQVQRANKEEARADRLAQALELANARADTGVRAAEISAAIFQAIGSQRIPVQAIDAPREVVVRHDPQAPEEVPKG